MQPRFASLVSLCLGSILALATSSPARAEEYGDLVVNNIVLTPQGANVWAVDIEYGFALTSSWPTQPLLIRLYENDVPVEDLFFGAPPPPNAPESLAACCLDAGECGWSGPVTCGGVCPTAASAPRKCLRSGIQPATPRPAPPSLPGSVPRVPGKLKAVIDPDGWHTELHDPLRANNAFEIEVPADEAGEIALQELRVIPQAAPGMFRIEVDLRVIGSASIEPTQEFVARLSGPLSPRPDGIKLAIGVPRERCCDVVETCIQVWGWGEHCGYTCSTQIPGLPYVCFYSSALSWDDVPLTPGDVVAVELDPENLYREVWGTPVDNFIAATVPGGTTFYGTGKLNSAGCVPSMFSVGTASATSPQAFVLGTHQVLPARSGLMFYGFGQNSQPAFGGTMLVQFPVTRTPVQISSGTFGDPGCGGSYAYDFNARIRSGIDPNLIPGVSVAAQHWYRDSAASFGMGFSNAAWFQIEP